MASQQDTNPHHETGFLDLPVEIRLEIYALLLHMPESSKLARCGSSPANHIHAALLLANRQINAEATPFLYGDNTFLAHPNMLASFPRLRSWYGPVKESAVVPRIRRFHVQVRLDCELPYDADAVAAAFSGLDELDVDLVQSMYLGVGHANLRKFETVRGVRRVHISGSTTGFEDYIRWLEASMTSDMDAKVEDFVPAQQGWSNRLASIH